MLCVGAVLPLHEARVEVETELQWAAESERAAPFSLLRPLLSFHFDAMLPLFLLCTHTDDLLHGALFQSALLQPSRAGHPESSVCALYLRMTEAALVLPQARMSLRPVFAPGPIGPSLPHTKDPPPSWLIASCRSRRTTRSRPSCGMHKMIILLQCSSGASYFSSLPSRVSAPMLSERYTP